MPTQDFKKKFLTHTAVIAFMLTVNVVYFSPMFFKGQILQQSDIIQWRGGAEELIQYKTKNNGKQSFWTNSMFSGMPSYFVSTEYRGNLMGQIQRIMSLNMAPPALQVFVSMVGFYILAMVLSINPILAALGAIAFGFSSFSIISLEAGHNGKVYAMAYLPLVMAGMICAYRKNLVWGGVLFSTGLALNMLSNHLQITYYLVIIAIIYGLVELYQSVKNKTLVQFGKATGVLLITAAIAVGTNIAAIMTTAEYGKFSIRGKSELQPKEGQRVSDGLDVDYAFDWSYGIDETLTILIPGYYGGSSTEAIGKNTETYKFFKSNFGEQTAKEQTQNLPMYFGKLNFTSGPIYFGAIIVFLFVLGMFIVRSELKWWLFAATIFSFMLSWGENFSILNYFLFDYLPGYNKFRAVMMGLVIAQFCMPVLAVLAVDELFKTVDVQKTLKQLYIVTGALGAICLFVWIGAGSRSYDLPSDETMKTQFAKQIGPELANQFIQALLADREGIVTSDAFRSLVFILLAAALLYLGLTKKLNTQIVTIILVVFVLLDVLGVDKRYLNDKNFIKKKEQTYFNPTPTDEQILQDKSLSYRVYNMGNPFNEARTSYFHKSIGGYSAAKMRRYQDLIERQISTGNMEVLNMLNAKYFITGDERQPVYPNPNALGNAWFVRNVKYVNSPDEEINSLTGLNPAKTLIVDKTKFTIKNTQLDSANNSIKLVQYEPNYLKYEYDAEKPGVVVFSEIYYPIGWTSKIDGKETPHIRGNYVLRAMEVPQGKHIIEFSFVSESYETGTKISYFCSILVSISLLGMMVWYFKNELAKKEELPTGEVNTKTKKK